MYEFETHIKVLIIIHLVKSLQPIITLYLESHLKFLFQSKLQNYPKKSRVDHSAVRRISRPGQRAIRDPLIQENYKMCRLFPRPQGKELFYKSASKEINNKSWHLCPRGTSTKADKTHIATAIHSLEFSSLSIAFSLNGSLAFTEGLRKQPLKAQYNPTIKLRVEFLLSFLKYS